MNKLQRRLARLAKLKYAFHVEEPEDPEMNPEALPAGAPSPGQDVMSAVVVFANALREKLESAQDYNNLSEAQQRILDEVNQLLGEATEMLVSGEYDNMGDIYDETEFMADDEEEDAVEFASEDADEQETEDWIDDLFNDDNPAGKNDDYYL